MIVFPLRSMVVMTRAAHGLLHIDTLFGVPSAVEDSRVRIVDEHPIWKREVAVLKEIPSEVQFISRAHSAVKRLASGQIAQKELRCLQVLCYGIEVEEIDGKRKRLVSWLLEQIREICTELTSGRNGDANNEESLYL